MKGRIIAFLAVVTVAICAKLLLAGPYILLAIGAAGCQYLAGSP